MFHWHQCIVVVDDASWCGNAHCARPHQNHPQPTCCGLGAAHAIEESRKDQVDTQTNIANPGRGAILAQEKESIVSLWLQAFRITGVRLLPAASAQLSLKRCLQSQFIMASTPWCWRTVGQTDKLWVFLPGCPQKPFEATEALMQTFLQRFDTPSSSHLGVDFAFPVQYHAKFDSDENADKKTHVQGMFVCLDLLKRKNLRTQRFELVHDMLAALRFANRRSLNSISQRLGCQQKQLAFDICWTPSTRSLDSFTTEALMASLEQATDLALLAQWPGTSHLIMLLETNRSWNIQENIPLEPGNATFPDRRMNISSSYGFLALFDELCPERNHATSQA